MTDKFLVEVRQHIPANQIYTDPLRRIAWGTDAGCYSLTPQVVIQSRNEADIIAIVHAARKHQLSLTFRAAGTSLSGQAITDSVLVIAGSYWENYTLAPDLLSIRLQPGIVGQRVNEILEPFGKKFPPDPASIHSAMVGGIVQNNASGMSCGIHENSYRMLLSARLILADGTILDTGNEQSKANFRQTHPYFLQKLSEIKRNIEEDSVLKAQIQRKYAIKNVTGLSINAFVDFDDPFDILSHLIVGSEGTLAFLSEVTMKTVDNASHKASSMLYFPTMRVACEAVVALKSTAVTAVELFDRQAIRSVDNQPNALPQLKLLPNDGTVLLIKTEADSPHQLRKQCDHILEVLKPFPTLYAPFFAFTAEEYNPYWHMRSGIFPTVGSTRATGTTCLIEDVAFQLKDIPQATADLRALLIRNHYADAVIYGHALEGNFHFILNQSFDTQTEIDRYETLMSEVVDLVVHTYQGSLKAEHGTGRNMAPFVEKEWGSKAFAIMKEVKKLFDPDELFNRGVIFNDDPHCHLKHFKSLPKTHSLIDQCIECGFCEVNCVSSGFTLSARQRIVIQREIQRCLSKGENPSLTRSLQKAFRYAGIATCAVDGLCSVSCPVGINVGDYVKELRTTAMNQQPAAQYVGAFAARHFKGIAQGIKSVLWLANGTRNVLGNNAMLEFTKGLRYVTFHQLPAWTPALPLPASTPKPLPTSNNPLKVVYFPSCINRTMGVSQNDPDTTSLVQKTIALLTKAGYEVVFPHQMESLCCGNIWESKGMAHIGFEQLQKLEEALWQASAHGEFPVLCDQSPCIQRMRSHIQKMKLYEPAEFIHDFLMDKLTFVPIDEPITVYATCSTRKMGLEKKLMRVAQKCSHQVVVPEHQTCCGFAGDKGFVVPELNAHGLRKLRQQLTQAGVKKGYSNSRTCEIGLNTHGGIPYMSIVYLVDNCSEKKEIS